MPKRTYNRRGKPTGKDIKNLRYAKAILEAKTMKEAHQKTHPNSSPSSSNNNAYRMVNQDVVDIVQNLLDLQGTAKINRENIVKMLQLVISRYIQKKESGTVYMAAIKLLTELVPEFKERLEVTETSQKSDEDIDLEIIKLRQLGLDPNGNSNGAN